MRDAWRSDSRDVAVTVIPEDTQQSFTFVTSDVGEARDRLAKQVDASITLHQVDVDSEGARAVEGQLAELTG